MGEEERNRGTCEPVVDRVEERHGAREVERDGDETSGGS